jgi:uncharacterized repeat protein (TIGR01451 family)
MLPMIKKTLSLTAGLLAAGILSFLPAKSAAQSVTAAFSSANAQAPLPEVYDRTQKDDGVVLKKQGFDTFGRKWRPGQEPAPAPPPAVATPAPAPAYISGNLVDISKSSPGMVALGETFETVLDVRANGDAADIVVTDVIPDGAELVSATPKPIREGNKLTWRFNAMDAGQVNKIRVKYKAVKVGDLRSCATVHALPRVCTVVVVGKPALKITKSGPATALINETVSYNVTVSNPGSMVAKNVVVTDQVPAGLTHSSGQKTVTFTVGDLAAKDSRTFSVPLTAAKKGKHCNVAVATSSNAGKVQAEACTTVLVPGLNIEKSGPALQFLGKLASYTIKVTNTGDTTLNDVVVTDTAPAATTIKSAPGASVVGNTAVWNIASLASGADKTFKVVLTTMVAGTHENCAGVTSRQGLNGRDCAATVWKGISALLITVEDDPDPILVGETTTYTIRVTNQGTADDTDIKLVADFEALITPTGASNGGAIAGKKVSFPAYPRLAPKQSFTYTITAKGDSKGDHRLKVTRTSKDIPKPTVAEESTRVY